MLEFVLEISESIITITRIMSARCLFGVVVQEMKTDFPAKRNASLDA